MKKIIYALTAVLLLCGCTPTDSGSSVSEEMSQTTVTTAAAVDETSQTTAEVTTLDVYIDEESDDSMDFASIDEFIKSDKYEEIIYKGYRMYYPEYDESKYTLSGISTVGRGNFYSFIYNENSSEEYIRITVKYNCSYETPEEYGNNMRVKNGMATTAESGGKTYDVYLVTSTIDTVDNYSLIYIPEERYIVTLNAGNASTTDEILQYFSEFELVAYAE